MNGQVLVKQTAEHTVTVHTQASATEGLVLSGEVQQVSEQLARATVYLLMDELVRYPASEQPYHLARIVRDKRFGFPVHLLQVKELDLDDDQRRRVVEGDTGDGAGQGRRLDPHLRRHPRHALGAGAGPAVPDEPLSAAVAVAARPPCAWASSA
ncbi:two-component sensor [Pseudomonas aeruginosa]|nr:two-component sensor [Pseudomonas aeruginosa]